MRLTQEPHYAFAPDAPSDAARLAEWIEAEIREDGMESGTQEAAAVPPPVADDQDPPRRRLLVGAALASLMLHAAAAAAFFSAAALPDYGVLANKSDAISLATTQTIVLDSIAIQPIEAAAAAAAAAQEGSVQSSDAEPVPLEQMPPPETIKTAEVTPDAVQPIEEPLDVLRGAGEPQESAETKAQEKPKEPTEQRPDELETKEREKVEREERVKERREQAQRFRSRQQVAGASTARAASAAAAVSGQVSASRGSVLSYAARVRAQVARNKPSGDGHRGTTRVSFAVTSSGDLSYARVASSSGSATLDEKAVSAVLKAAPFGAPPAGAGPDQLRFSIPFYFR